MGFPSVDAVEVGGTWQKILIGSIYVISAGENFAPSQWLFDKFEDTGVSVINDTHRYEGGVVGHSDATSLSTTVSLTWPMMEDEVAEAILKTYGQKEGNADPPVTLWDSWFYVSCKSDRARMHPLAENWQHLLGIFCKISLQWLKNVSSGHWSSLGKGTIVPPI